MINVYHRPWYIIVLSLKLKFFANGLSAQATQIDFSRTLTNYWRMLGEPAPNIRSRLLDQHSSDPVITSTTIGSLLRLALPARRYTP